MDESPSPTSRRATDLSRVNGFREESRRLAVLDTDAAFIRSLTSASKHLDWEVVPINDISDDVGTHFFVLDICPDGRPRLDRIEQIQRADPRARIVGVTLYPSLSLAVSAVKAGAVDCLAKPIDATELLAAFDSPWTDAETHFDSLPSLARVEWDYIARVLERVNGNISQASRILRIQRSTLQRKLKKYPPAW